MYMYFNLTMYKHLHLNKNRLFAFYKHDFDIKKQNNKNIKGVIFQSFY